MTRLTTIALLTLLTLAAFAPRTAATGTIPQPTATATPCFCGTLPPVRPVVWLPIVRQP